MRFDKHVALATRLRDLIRAGDAQMDEREYRIPVDHYVCSDRFQSERSELFRGFPLPVAAATQLEQPGDTLAIDLPGMPIVIARNRQGSVGAFINACRHRGVRVADGEDVCQRKAFVCPYHNWTYDLDGALKGIPKREGFPNVDVSQHGLRRLPATEAHGLIWVLPDPDGAMNLNDHLGELAEDLNAYDFGKFQYFARRTTTVKANWKLILDAFSEGYHVSRLHKDSLAPYFPDHTGVFDAIGPHMRSFLARKDFLAVLDQPVETWHRSEHFTLTLYAFPNTIIVFSPDYATKLAMYPVSPSETFVTMTLMTPHKPRSEAERQHWQRSFALLDEFVFGKEDFGIAESAQTTLESGANTHLTAGRFEPAIRCFHQAIDKALLPKSAARK